MKDENRLNWINFIKFKDVCLKIYLIIILWKFTSFTARMLEKEKQINMTTNISSTLLFSMIF